MAGFNTYTSAKALFQRDVRLAWSQGGTGTMAISFFLIAVSLFPFGVGAEPTTLARIGPGIIWVVALFACMLSLDRIFQADFEDGYLDQIATSPLPMVMAVIAKTLAHWVASVLPLIIVSPMLAMMMQMDDEAIKWLVITLLVGSPALSFIGAAGAGLTVAIKRGGVLLSLLVLPLYIPTLVFGVGAVMAAATLLDPLPHLALLGAVSLIAVIVGSLAASAALKLAME